MEDLRSKMFLNEEDIMVVPVKDCHLKKFPIFMKVFENEGIGMADGGFILRVHHGDRGPVTPLRDLIHMLKEGFVHSYVQNLVRTPWEDSLYGYKPEPANSDWSKMFSSTMKDSDSYTEAKTCCTHILKHKGAKAVVNHFFEVMAESATVMVSERATEVLSMSIESELNHLTELGKFKKAEYDKYMDVLSSHCNVNGCGAFETFDVYSKSTYTCCNCPDCFTEDEEHQRVGIANMYKQNISQCEESARMNEVPLCSAGIMLPQDLHIRITPNFSLSKTFSVLSILNEKIPGVHIPYFYVNGIHSMFMAHVEDAGLMVMNYIHYGNPKLWMIIHSRHLSRLQELFHLSTLNVSQSSCRNVMGHNFFLPTQKYLYTHKIPYKIVLQRPGDIVLLYPNTVHFGFSLGNNMSEAVKFGTESWIPIGIRSLSYRCNCYEEDKVHLDMRLLVATFCPEHLRNLLSRKPVPNYKDGSMMSPVTEPANSRNYDHENEYQCEEGVEKETVQTKKNVKLLVCPYTKCDKTYQDHRRRLILHVQKCHPNDQMKLMKIIDSKYPAFTPSMNYKRHKCLVCGKPISGSKTHLEKHYMKQMNNEQNTLKLRLDYKMAYENLLIMMAKTRRKSCKVISERCERAMFC